MDKLKLKQLLNRNGGNVGNLSQILNEMNDELNVVNAAKEDAFEVTRLITEAEIENGHVQYVNIIPAPGENKVIFPTEVFMIYKFNTAGYNAVTSYLYFDDGFYVASELANVPLNLTEDRYVFAAPGIIGDNPFQNKAALTNKGIVFLVGGAGAGTTGDSTVWVKIKYKIIDVSDLP